VSEAERKDEKITSIVFDDTTAVGTGSQPRHGWRERRLRSRDIRGASVRYGNHGQVNLGTLGTRYGGIQRGSRSMPIVQAGRRRGARIRRPLTKDASLFGAPAHFRVMVCCYLASARL